MRHSLPSCWTLCIVGVLCALASGTSLAGVANAPPDTMAQRLLACTSCHGKDGAGSPHDPGVPSLAGKPAGYLLQQLVYFRTGQRHYPPMEYVTRQLSPQYMRQIADYFSQQDVPVHAGTAPALPAAVLARGKQLVDHGDPSLGVPSCKQCHGDRLTGVKPMVPGLAGLSYDYIRAQLQLWRSHKRGAGGTFCMGVVANRLRGDDVDAVAGWVASRPVPKDMSPVASRADAAPLPGWCVLGKGRGAS